MKEGSKNTYICPNCDQEVITKVEKFNPNEDYVCKVNWCQCKFKPFENRAVV